MLDLELMTEDVAIVDQDEAAREAWLQKRSGMITCSRFGDLIGEGKAKDALFTQTGYAYLQLLVAERLGSWYSFSNSATQWGTSNESIAIDEYRQLTGKQVDSTPFNFFQYNDYIGGTPDGLVGATGTIEVKCPFNPSVHVGTLLSKTVPKEYEWQVHGHMLVTDRFWCDFISFDPRIEGKQKIAIVRVERDDAKIAFLKSRLETAVKVMGEMLERLI
jgi:YqaJ-like viral recombinase domain